MMSESDIPTRTHAQRVAEVTIITTSVQANILRAFELRDQEIDALRLRVEQEAAEVRRLTDALATARLDGARAMREAAIGVANAHLSRRHPVRRRIAALDPAAVVGSGS